MTFALHDKFHPTKLCFFLYNFDNDNFVDSKIFPILMNNQRIVNFNF